MKGENIVVTGLPEIFKGSGPLQKLAAATFKPYSTGVFFALLNQEQPCARLQLA
jgi:hypothetical protein